MNTSVMEHKQHTNGAIHCLVLKSKRDTHVQLIKQVLRLINPFVLGWYVRWKLNLQQLVFDMQYIMTIRIGI